MLCFLLCEYEDRCVPISHRTLEILNSIAIINRGKTSYQSFPSCFLAKDVSEYVARAKVSNVPLEESDLEAILDTLISSNKVETEYDSVNEVLLYKVRCIDVASGLC